MCRRVQHWAISEPGFQYRFGARQVGDDTQLIRVGEFSDDISAAPGRKFPAAGG
ncbi:MAG: hypothetical protein WA958_20085 [Tunicatimonas sp.]